MSEEDKKLLLEMKSNCLEDRGTSRITYNDEKRIKKAKAIDNALKEIERLNNIINEAKIYCEDVIQEHENGEYDVDTVWLAIKEHKGNIKSVLNILNGDLKNYWRGDKE